MASDDRYIRIDGLQELLKGLRAEDESLVDIVKVANGKVAKLVRDKASVQAASLGRRGAVRAAATMKATQSLQSATLKLGNKNTPGALGEEFGAYRNLTRAVTRRNRHVTVLGWRQFQPWRGSGAGAGYFLWETIRNNRDEIRDTYLAELDRLHRVTFPDR